MKPKIAKKAQEDGGIEKPVPAPQGQYFSAAVPRKRDQQQGARLGMQEQDGEGTGFYSEWLAKWAKNISDTYNAQPVKYGCIPVLIVQFQNGHVTGAQPEEPKASCGEAADRAMIQAVYNAPRPPPPVGFGSDEQDWLLYQHPEAR